MEKENWEVIVSGKVQGVFYRASARDRARELGLNGFVRNDPEGSVFIEVEGGQPAINQFIEWCKRGPRNAKVEELTAKKGVFKGFKDFEIRRI